MGGGGEDGFFVGFFKRYYILNLDMNDLAFVKVLAECFVAVFYFFSGLDELSLLHPSHDGIEAIDKLNLSSVGLEKVGLSLGVIGLAMLEV